MASTLLARCVSPETTLTGLQPASDFETVQLERRVVWEDPSLHQWSHSQLKNEAGQVYWNSSSLPKVPVVRGGNRTHHLWWPLGYHKGLEGMSSLLYKHQGKALAWPWWQVGVYICFWLSPRCTLGFLCQGSERTKERERQRKRTRERERKKRGPSCTGNAPYFSTSHLASNSLNVNSRSPRQ